MPANNTTNTTAPEKPETEHDLPAESAQHPHRIAELIGVFENDPVWDAIMAEVRARRRGNEQEEATETTTTSVQVPTLRK